MDILSLLTNAKVNALDGVELGQVVGVHFLAGKMVITIDIDLEEIETDPDGGAKDDIPKDDASKTEFPKIVVMSKRLGTNDG